MTDIDFIDIFMICGLVVPIIHYVIFMEKWAELGISGVIAIIGWCIPFIIYLIIRIKEVNK